MAILQAIQGIMEMIREDRREKMAQQQREERALQEDEGVIDLVEQENKVRGRGWNNFMQPRRVERIHEDREWNQAQNSTL